MTPTKSYYKIGEVSAMLDVPVSTLRFWEDTFEQLDSFRTPGGTRKYRPEDVEMCRMIKASSPRERLLDRIREESSRGLPQIPAATPLCVQVRR